MDLQFAKAIEGIIDNKDSTFTIIYEGGRKEQVPQGQGMQLATMLEKEKKKLKQIEQQSGMKTPTKADPRDIIRAARNIRPRR